MPDSPTESNRLAAILFLDIVGYSKLMSRDERGALDVVREFEQIVRTEVAAAGGRLVKFLGDGSLAEFPTARTAVLAALKIQTAVSACADDAHPRGRFQVRAGLHLGDLTERGGDVFGDAVNIAARVQPLADPGGIALSGTVYDQVRTHLPLRGTRMTGVRLKNIPKKMVVFLVPPLTARLIPWMIRTHRRGLATIGVTCLLAAALGAYAWRRAHRDVSIFIAERLVYNGYAGGGATLMVESWVDDQGPVSRLKFTGGGQLGSYCGVTAVDARSVNDGDWRRYAGVRLRVQGIRAQPLRVLLVESGARRPGEDGEQWHTFASLSENPEDFLLPFSSFERSKDYQPPDQDGNGSLNLERVFKLCLQPMPSGTVSSEIYIRDIELVSLTRGQPPQIVGQIAGPASIVLGESDQFLVRVSDPENDRVRLIMDWGDGTKSETGFIPTDQMPVMRHAWSAKGAYTVRARAMDVQGRTSGWSDGLAVTVGGWEGKIDDFEDIGEWYTYAQNGAQIAVSSANGPEGKALQVDLASGGVWGVGILLPAEMVNRLSEFKGLEFSLRGTENFQVRVTLIERGKGGGDAEGEFWSKDVTAGKEWKHQRLVFPEFARMTWVPPGADNNRRLNIDKLLALKFLQVENAKGGTFSIAGLKFSRTPAASR